MRAVEAIQDSIMSEKAMSTATGASGGYLPPDKKTDSHDGVIAGFQNPA